MLPKIYKKKFQDDFDSPHTPIFHPPSQLPNRKKPHLEDHSRIISEICKDAVEIKKLNSRISKLTKDNELLKSFILSTNIYSFSANTKKNDLSEKIENEFEKLERFFK